MRFLGIDPGIKGGLACLNPDGTLYATAPMPTLTLRGKNVLVPQEIHDLLSDWLPIRFALIEQQHAMPKQGRSSIFKTGEGFGMLIGIVAAMGIPFDTIPPAYWKRSAKCPKDKNAARMLALRYWPDETAFTLKKNDGLAEAALLALVARKQV